MSVYLDNGKFRPRPEPFQGSLIKSEIEVALAFPKFTFNREMEVPKRITRFRFKARMFKTGNMFYRKLLLRRRCSHE